MEIDITKIKKNRSKRLQMFHNIDILKRFRKIYREAPVLESLLKWRWKAQQLY